MRHAVLFQKLAQFLRLRNGRRTDKDRPPRGVNLVDRPGNRPVLRPLRLEDEIRFVDADHRLIRRHHDDRQLIDLKELILFRLGRSRHSGELRVHAEIILEGDRRQRLGLALDLHALLRLDGLMEPVRVAAAIHQTARELIDNNDFLALYHIIAIPVHDRLRPERRREAVRILDVLRRVKILYVQHRFDFMHRLVAGRHRFLLFVDRVIDARLQRSHRLRHTGVYLGRLRARPGNDERRPRLVDEDTVHLVDDSEMKLALYHLIRGNDHVVAQIIEAVLVIRAESHVAAIIELARGKIHIMLDKPDGKAEELIKMPHPLAVAPRQIIVHRDHVNALAGQSVQINRQRRHQRFAFARLHLGNLALMQAHAADELHVKMAHPQHTARRLPTNRERLRQNIVQRFPRRQPLLKLLRIPGERCVADLPQSRFETVNLIDRKLHALNFFIVIIP